MAEGMAKWVGKNWQVKTKEDFDEYTYYVAGLVGVMLSELWKWSADIETDRELAIAYGRGLQAVNILRNVDEDSERGVKFFQKDGLEQTCLSMLMGIYRRLMTISRVLIVAVFRCSANYHWHLRIRH